MMVNGHANSCSAALAKDFSIIHAGVMELVDVMDSKSIGSDTVPVRVRPPAPNQYHPNLFPIGDGFGLLLFFDRYAPHFRNGVKRKPTSQRSPEEETGPINAKKGGRSRFHGAPALFILILYCPPASPLPVASSIRQIPAVLPRSHRKREYPA